MSDANLIERERGALIDLRALCEARGREEADLLARYASRRAAVERAWLANARGDAAARPSRRNARLVARERRADVPARFPYRPFFKSRFAWMRDSFEPPGGSLTPAAANSSGRHAR